MLPVPIVEATSFPWRLALDFGRKLRFTLNIS